MISSTRLLVLTTLITVLAPLSQSLAARAEKNPFFTISAVKTTEIPDLFFSEFSAPVAGFEANDPCAVPAQIVKNNSYFEVDPTTVLIDQILSIGAKLWQIADSQKPVVNVSSGTASALPKGTQCWLSLQSWQQPVTHLYHVEYQNMFGANVIDFVYRVGFTYGGSFNGKGSYIANAFLQAAKLDVAWGYKFDSEAQVVSTLNMGTRLSPVAGMQVQITHRVRNIITDKQVTDSFFITGAGTLQRLN